MTGTRILLAAAGLWACLLSDLGRSVTAPATQSSTPIRPSGSGHRLEALHSGVIAYGRSALPRATGPAHRGAPVVATEPVTTARSLITWACTRRAQMGHCAFGADRQITGVSSEPWVDNNVWNPVSGWRQLLRANSPGDWQVLANMPTGNSAIASYPNTGVDLSGRVNRYAQITSSFSETMHAHRETSAWAMYDLWFNDWTDEVMIQYDFARNGDCTPVATATFGGSHGVPVRAWHLCDLGGGTLDWKLGRGEGAQKRSEHSGTVDILAMVKWLESHGYLAKSSTWTALSDGWEICSTGSHDETFTLSSYSVTASEAR